MYTLMFRVVGKAHPPPPPRQGWGYRLDFIKIFMLTPGHSAPLIYISKYTHLSSPCSVLPGGGGRGEGGKGEGEGGKGEGGSKLRNFHMEMGERASE
jgi:hypothetical protein